jgi:hypothetical protein
LNCFKWESEASGLVDESFAKLTIAEDESHSCHERQLPRNNIICEGSRAHKDFDVLGANQLAQNFLRLLKILHEAIGTVRDWLLDQRLPDI